MARTCKKKTIPAASNNAMKNAVEKVIKKEGSIRKIAKDYGLDRITLSRYIKKGLVHDDNSIAYVPKLNTRQIFTSEQEGLIVDYLLKTSKINFGLSTNCTRKLAYQFGVANNISMPATWITNEKAGIDWLFGFMRRHNQLALRSPEATSLSRSTSFNRTNVNDFFDKLNEVMTRNNFEPQNIYNVDETGFTAVQHPIKVIAEKGVKQVGRVTSGERGTLVIMCGAMNAIGNAVPPMFIFPRVNFKDHMLKGGPVGCIGVAQPSGWMNADSFLDRMKHFVRHVRCTSENPVLLLLHNHDSHISIELLDFAKLNGVTMLTFPPHCSHKMQPLDRTVYGPMKRYFNAAADTWVNANPGSPMTIYDIAELVGYAFPLAFTQKNIQSGFKLY